MKNISKLLLEAKMDLEAIDIETGFIRNIKVNTRAKKRWGMCSRVGINTFDIEISDSLLDDSISYEATMNTIIHELLHTCKGCMNHGPEWKKLAERVNSFYPQYNIKRTTSTEEKGIAADTVAIHYKYIVTCQDCGLVCKYQKRGAVVQALQRNARSCQCGNCKSKNLKLA